MSSETIVQSRAEDKETSNPIRATALNMNRKYA
jgi:hypothetical protein